MSKELTTFNFEITSLQQAMDYAKIMADSDLVPKDYKGKAGNVLVAIQYGMEIGLKPLQALQNISIINGRPCVWGDAMLALVQNNPVCEYIVEEFKNDIAYCNVKRRGEPEYTQKFSKENAKTAGLLGKQGVWQQYPQRMLQMRARAFALRDKFSDVLKGMAMREEVMDFQEHSKEENISKAKEKLTTLIEGKVLNNYISTEEIIGRISNAKTKEELTATEDDAGKVYPDDKQKVREAYKKKKNDLRTPEDVVILSEEEKIKNQLLKASCRDTLDIAADLIKSVASENQSELLEIYQSRLKEFS